MQDRANIRINVHQSIPELSEEEIIRYNEHVDMMDVNIRLLKKARRKKKPFRYAKKVERLKCRLPIESARTLYPFKKKEIDRIRVLAFEMPDAEDDGKKKSKKSTILILGIALLVILGVGGYFLYNMFGNKTGADPITGDVLIVNADSLSVPIDNARLNQDIEKKVTVRNATNGAMYLRFAIQILDETGGLPTGKMSELGIKYTFNTQEWYLDAQDNYLYYKGVVPKTTDLEPITHFQITSQDYNEDYWAEKGLQLKFVVDMYEATGVDGVMPPGWPDEWVNIIGGN